MDVNTRSRTDLKTYFVKNAIPTESNFAELIDGMFNQSELVWRRPRSSQRLTFCRK